MRHMGFMLFESGVICILNWYRDYCLNMFDALHFCALLMTKPLHSPSHNFSMHSPKAMLFSLQFPIRVLCLPIRPLSPGDPIPCQNLLLMRSWISNSSPAPVTAAFPSKRRLTQEATPSHFLFFVLMTKILLSSTGIVRHVEGSESFSILIMR